MSVSAAVNNSSLSDSRPRLTNGMAAEVTTYASIASMGACAEFIPSRATRQSNNPILREVNIDGRSIVQQKGLYCRPSRQLGGSRQQLHHGEGASTAHVGDQIKADLVRSEATGEYLALEFRHNEGRAGQPSGSGAANGHAAVTSGAGPSSWIGGGQEARGLQPSAQYMNLVQLNDIRQAHAWFGGSAHAAEQALQSSRNSAQATCSTTSAPVTDARHQQCLVGARYGPNDSSTGHTARTPTKAPTKGECPDTVSESSSSSSGIYINSSFVSGQQRAPSERDVTVCDVEPVYINASPLSSNESFRSSLHSGSSSLAVVGSPAVSPLASPGVKLPGQGAPLNRAKELQPISASSSSASSCDTPQHAHVENQYENTRGQQWTGATAAAIAHVRSPSEPCHAHPGFVGNEFGQLPPHGHTFASPQPIYMNDAHSHSPGQQRLSRRSRSACSLQADSDNHNRKPKGVEVDNPLTASASPSPQSLSPLGSPGKDEVDGILQSTTEHDVISFQSSNADTLFGTFHVRFMGAEQVDRGYGVIPQAVRNVVKRCNTSTAVARNVTMTVSATSVTCTLEDGTEKFRHEVDSIESISPWQEGSVQLSSDLVSYAAYIVVQEGVSAVCYIFQASDPGARRTVCKTIESALYADVKNFKSMTYPRYEIQPKIKSASQFSVKYIGSILVQSTFSVIDDAARRLLSSTNPAKIGFAFMDVGEDRIRLTGTTTSVIFAAHPTSSIACLNVFSEDGRVFGYVVKQKGAGTKCHVFRCSRPSLAFAIVDIIKDVIQDNYKTNDSEEQTSAKADGQKSNGIRGFWARRREKRGNNASAAGNASASNGGHLSSLPQKSGGQASGEQSAASDSRVRSVSDITGLPSAAAVIEASVAVIKRRVDYLGALSVQQDLLTDVESRQIIEKMNSVRKHSYLVTMSISDRGVALTDDYHKTREIGVKSIVSVRLHPENAHYALIVSRPQLGSSTRYCHIVHQLSRTASDILRDVARLLV